MKKIGVVGGISWLSTVDYYSEICRRGEQAGLAPLEMSIESLDLPKVFSYLGRDGDEESWSRFDEYHRTALRRLEASGADFALLAANTPHHRLDSIVRGVGIPVVGIFDAAAKEAARIGASQALILGTALTMSSQVFRDAFAKYGVEADGPEDEGARSATVALIHDLQRGHADSAAERLGRIAKAACRRFTGQPAVCLACTELPLAFPDRKALPHFEVDGVTYINTTIVHVIAALVFAAGGAGA